MIRIGSGSSVGASNDDLFSVVSENKAGEDIALSFGNASPSTTLLMTFRRTNSIGFIEDRFPPMELEGNISPDASSGFKGGDATESFRGHVVGKECHAEEEAEKPEGSRCAGAVHDGAGEAFHITNFAFSKILILMLSLTFIGALAKFSHAPSQNNYFFVKNSQH
jgi:hypothetical protein